MVIVFSNWSIEGFRNLHDEDFLFIRETELLTLKYHIENIAHLVETSSFLKILKVKFLSMKTSLYAKYGGLIEEKQ